MSLTGFEWTMFAVIAVAAVVLFNVRGAPAPTGHEWLHGGKNSYEGVIVIHAERG